MSSERHSFVRGVNIAHIKPSEGQLESILYHPNPYPSIQSRNARLATFKQTGEFSNDIYIQIVYISQSRAFNRTGMEKIPENSPVFRADSHWILICDSISQATGPENSSRNRSSLPFGKIVSKSVGHCMYIYCRYRVPINRFVGNAKCSRYFVKALFKHFVAPRKLIPSGGCGARERQRERLGNELVVQPPLSPSVA